MPCQIGPGLLRNTIFKKKILSEETMQLTHFTLNDWFKVNRALKSLLDQSFKRGVLHQMEVRAMLSLCLVMQIDGFEIFSQQRQIKFQRIITSGEARSAFVFPARTERKSGFGRGLVGSSHDLVVPGVGPHNKTAFCNIVF